MLTLTNNLVRTIASLATRKGRRREQAFMAEGTKCVLDTLPHFTLRHLCATPAWWAAHPELASLPQALEASAAHMHAMSALTTPADVLAVYDIPVHELDPASLHGKLTLALDTLQDPGNLGTVIRLADWYGITDILCSHGTADCWSPKVIQATMGSVSRVRVHYCDLAAVLPQAGETVYGTFLDGDDLFDTPLTPTGIIVTGNEGQGISPQVEAVAHRRLTIPSWPPGAATGESLNAAVATAITVSRFRSLMQR